MTLIYSDSFDADTAGALAAGWSNVTGTWRVGTLRPVTGTQSFGDTAASNGDVALYTAATAAADMEVFYNETIGTAANSSAIGCVLRSDSTFANAYAILIYNGPTGSNQLILFKRVSSSFTQLTVANIADFVSGHTYGLRAQIVGTAIKARIWDITAGTAEPTTWQINTTDSSITAAGYAGLYNGGTALNSIDDFMLLNPDTTGAATTIALSGPSSGGATATSTVFTVSVNGTLASTLTVTPSDGGAGGTFNPATITIASGSNPAAQSFTYTPSAAGTKTLSFSNNGSLTNPANKTYTAGSSAATAITVSGPSSGAAGLASSNFTALVNGSLTAAVTVTPSDGGNGGTFTPTTVTFAVGSSPPAQTLTYTPGSAGAKTLSFTNNGSLANPATLTYTATAVVAIAPNNAAIIYSPGNWDVTATRALSINAGAYFRTLFSGSSITLNFNVASMVSPATEIYYRIDGYESQSPWIKASIAATITPTMPSDMSSFPYHLIEVMIKSTSYSNNRWNTGTGCAVLFTGLTLASGGTVVAPGVAPNGSILFFGDSITEGLRTVQSSASNECDNSDAMMGWAYEQKNLLGIEAGIIGFGATGLTVAGQGNVPVFASTLGYIMSGLARSSSIANLKLIVLNEGTNDGSASASAVTTALKAVLNTLISTYSGVPIAVMRPFNGTQAAALQAGITGCSNPSIVHWIDTTGFFNVAYGADSLNLHPSGPNNLAIIAPQVAAALKPVLVPASASGATIRTTGSRGGLR